MTRTANTVSNVTIKTFSYRGDGNTIRKIDVGFSPDVVFIKGNTSQYGVFKTPQTYANATPYIVNAAAHLATGGIKEIFDLGFIVDNHATVNSAGVIYHGFAIKGNANSVAYGNYAGDEVSGREITCGFRPAFVMVKRDNIYAALYRDKLDADNTCHIAGNNADVTTDILSFTDTGFTVGSTQGINHTSGLGYTWFAIADIPEMNQISYVGNGNDNRNITGFGFDPTYVLVKGSELFEKFSQKTIIGDLSGDFNNSGGFLTDRIQGFVTDGFQVGTQTTVNQNGTTYHAIGLIDTAPRVSHSAKDFGTCLSFDGVNDIVTIPSGANLNNLTQISVAAWIKPKSVGESSGGRIFSKGAGLSNRLRCATGGTNSFVVTAGFDTYGQWQTPNNSVKLNVWQFVVFTLDLSSVNNEPVLYLNAVSSEVIQNQAPVGNLAADDTNAYIGNDSTTARTFNGLIDDVKVYNRILTQAEVIDLYQGKDVSSGLVGHWKLDEGSGLTATDSSGNGQDGTITGAVYSTNVVEKSRSVASSRTAVSSRIVNANNQT